MIGKAWIGWHEGCRFEHLAAWLIDISSGGCLVATQGRPPSDRPVLIRLDGPYLPHWFEASVLSIRESDTLVCAVRMAFPNGCPYDLFMGVVYGRFTQEEPPAPIHRPDRDRR